MPPHDQRVSVVAPCRIHMGLLSVREYRGRRFGGAGVMLEQPALSLQIATANQDSFAGPLANRAKAFTDHWREATGISSPVDCRILKAPPQHVGLGLGTQLGMSVAKALDTLFERPSTTIAQQAASVGRGLRSAVGAYGFHQGGFIAERGKAADDTLGQLESHLMLPSTWRVMLVRAKTSQGLAGDAEVQAFKTLEQTNSDTQIDALANQLFQRVVPAATAQDFEAFAEAVYQYGLSAGKMFAASQGGPFLNDSIANFVQYCRDHGILGVGQSSWGPTVYCWFPDEEAAEAFQRDHIVQQPNLEPSVIVTAVAQSGATVEWVT